MAVSTSPDATEATAALDNMPKCDLVMKGGVTSGVVYPKAIVRVAQKYRIHSIGGTSVGALAAAVTAAAEYWRQENPERAGAQQQQIDAIVQGMSTANWDSDNKTFKQTEREHYDPGSAHDQKGFMGIYGIPQEIGSDLLRKFQPATFTHGIFRYIVSIISARNTGGKILAAVWRQFYIFRLVFGVLFGLIALALMKAPELGFWLAGASLGLVILCMALSIVTIPIFLKLPSIAKAGIALFVVAGLLVWSWYLIERGLGWRNIWTWIDTLADANPKWVAPLIVVAFTVCFWKWIEKLILQPFHGERLYRVDRSLSICSTIIGIAGATLVIVKTWDWVDQHRGEVGTTGIGFTIGWIAGAAVAAAVYLGLCLPKNYNGMCTGKGDRYSLTNWLTDKIDIVATGTSGSGPHLTAADLEQHQIQFEVISSDLTRGVPIDLPKALTNYRFRPREFMKFFPASVVQQLVGTGNNVNSKALTPFPFWKDIPIVVSARMSLSFPVLLSAVPVYHLLQTRRNWLSDGGIVSNFPLHKFDRALPPWPTFALDLVDRDIKRPEDVTQQFVVSPLVPPPALSVNSPPSPAGVPKTQSDTDTGDLIGFATRILSTARGWMDNSQKTLPGYKERIVQIYMYRGEGGLNLQMDSKTIRRLSDRGMCGMHYLLNLWQPDTAGNATEWDQHRWLRYKILMRELEQIGREWKWLFDPASPSLERERTISDLVSNNSEFDQFRQSLAFRWASEQFANDGRSLTTQFTAFSEAAGTGVDMTALTPAEAFLEPIAFDQQHSPSLHPKRFSIPPFE